MHIDVDGDAFTNLSAVAALTNLNNLEINNVANPQDFSFLTRLVNLNSLDLGSDQVGSIAALTNLTQLNSLYLNTDFLTDISPLLVLPNLGNEDVSYNLLDTNAISAACGTSSPASRIIIMSM